MIEMMRWAPGHGRPTPLLQIHHVRPGPDQFAWDLGFLAWGAVMLAVGWWLARRPASRPALEQAGMDG